MDRAPSTFVGRHRLGLVPALPATFRDDDGCGEDPGEAGSDTGDSCSSVSESSLTASSSSWSRGKRKQPTSPLTRIAPFASLPAYGMPSPLEQPRMTLKGLARVLAFHVCAEASRVARREAPRFRYEDLRLDAGQLGLLTSQLVVDPGSRLRRPPSPPVSPTAPPLTKKSRRERDRIRRQGEDDVVISPPSPVRRVFSDDFARELLCQCERQDEEGDGVALTITMVASPSQLARVGILAPPELPTLYLVRSHVFRYPAGVLVALAARDAPLSFFPLPDPFRLQPPPAFAVASLDELPRASATKPVTRSASAEPALPPAEKKASTPRRLASYLLRKVSGRGRIGKQQQPQQQQAKTQEE